jgi:Zn ribbon nucleic-acid-binding protein
VSSPDDTCSACSFDEGTTYEAENGQFRIWCVACGHSTKRYSDLGLAQLEWLGRREATSA